MIENDVGGGYGARGEFYPEDFLIPFAARHVNRPVKWIEDRRENLMAMNHARETEAHLEIACERDGTIIGLRGEVHTDMGAYMRTNGAVGARNVVQFMGGPYRVPHVKLDSHLWMTNKTPVGTYRGPGRFEFELLHRAAARHGGGRSRHRPRRIAPPQPGDRGRAALPDRVGAADRRQRPVRQRRLSRDVRARLKEFDWAEKSKLAGKLIDGHYHGLAICFVEGGAAGPKESARLEVNDDGTITVFMGSSAVGQGVETVFAQIAADALEIPIERIRHVYHGSTTTVSDGYGAYHSRSIVMGGSALLDADGEFPGRDPRGRREEARLRRGRDQDRERQGQRPAASRSRLANSPGSPPKARSSTRSTPTAIGAHAAHITVDAKLGQVQIIDYVVVQDVGRAINPLTLRGQVIGSLVQGLGGAMLEHLQYDEQGQFLTGSLADYLLPTATDFPNLRCVRHRRSSLADQSARRQGRRRGRHRRRRRRDGERGGERAVLVRGRAAALAADAELHLGTGAGGLASRRRSRPPDSRFVDAGDAND